MYYRRFFSESDDWSTNWNDTLVRCRHRRTRSQSPRMLTGAQTRSRNRRRFRRTRAGAQGGLGRRVSGGWALRLGNRKDQTWDYCDLKSL